MANWPIEVKKFTQHNTAPWVKVSNNNQSRCKQHAAGEAVNILWPLENASLISVPAEHVIRPLSTALEAVIREYSAFCIYKNLLKIVEKVNAMFTSNVPGNIFLYIFWLAKMCWPLLCLCLPSCIFERCLDSNAERCRCKQERYQLSYPSPKLSHPSPNNLATHPPTT
jgi:hypothetical protein